MSLEVFNNKEVAAGHCKTLKGGALAIFVLTSLFFALPIRTHATGISPALIEVENISPNATVERKVYVSRADAVSSQRYLFSVGGSAVQYLELPNDGIVQMESGQNQAEYAFLIKPGSLGTGTYEATIAVHPVVEEVIAGTGGGSGSRIISGARADIRFTVTNEAIESYKITDVSMNDTEEEAAVGFSYLMTNDGNVDARPSKIDFSLTDEMDPTNTYQETILGEKLAFVPAFSEKRVDVLTGAALNAGLYKVGINFADQKGEEIYSSTSIRLQVFPEGTLEQNGTLESVMTDKQQYQAGELVEITGSFKNTGKVGITAALTAELFLSDKRLDILKSDPLFVPANQTIDLDVTFRPQDGGEYRAKAYANYGPHKTGELETTFKVNKFDVMILIIFLAAVTVVLGGSVFYFHRRRQKNAL